MADLPFQWEDGTFISPFVAASEEDMKAFAEWITTRCLSPIVESCSVASSSCADQRCAVSRSHELRLTDLGCGDATAVLSLAQHISKGWCSLHSTTAGASFLSGAASLHITVTGIDLDDGLLETAAANASAFAAASSSSSSSLVSVETLFVAEDLCTADVDIYFPRRVQGGGASSCASALPPCVLYMYLLPEALAQLREKLVQIMERGWLVASNRWPIPGLEAFLRERAGRVHIYSHATL
ncbi:hypothetical protein JKF63_04928 [Porcisia hertigi]|uniref:Methyltransferase domain-containing protein n=1 Tax=Porcisia hertigi TaxID=2761500 RepID=A0A836IRU1_9TRYP|nr:hypothetical protein JKF63_04928 [Porcisia hertigi]